MTIAEKMLRARSDYDEVYDAGYTKGQSESDGGYDEGYAAGARDAYDEYWDNTLNYGKRGDLRYLYSGSAFAHIDPKYAIKVTNADSMMTNAKVETVNWEKFDLSSVNSLYSAFALCPNLKSIDTDLAVVAGSANTYLNSLCRNCTSLVRVKKITAFPTAVWKQSFDNCAELVEIIFDGTIGANGLDLHWSTKLNRTSIESIINALSTDTTGLTVTLSLVAVKKAFETSEGANDGDTSPAWTTLKATKSNWTIALV